MNTTHSQARAVLLFMAVILVATLLTFARANTGMDAPYYSPTTQAPYSCTTDSECGCTMDCLE